jgi:acetoin utilization deacetylase AcuC-like enzyme
VKPRFVFSPRYSADIGDHVFPTAKFALTADLLRSRGEFVEPELPAREDLLLAHDEEWVDKVLSGRMSLDDELRMELAFSPAVSEAHRLAAAGTALACRDALERGVGLHVGGGSHHAFRDHGEGFCVLNDIAVGLLKMRAEGRVLRAAVIDLDVHQGNGTAAIFRADPAVFTFSMHQQDIYPAVKERGSLDVGLGPGTGDREYLSRLRESLPRVFDHGPQLVVYQAGVDCWEKDLLGGLKLTAEGLRERDRTVYEECRKRRIPVAVTVGGGYADVIKDTALLHAQTLSVFGGDFVESR